MSTAHKTGVNRTGADLTSLLVKVVHRVLKCSKSGQK